MDAGRISKMYILAKPIIHGVQRQRTYEIIFNAKQKMEFYGTPENLHLSCIGQNDNRALFKYINDII